MAQAAIINRWAIVALVASFAVLITFLILLILLTGKKKESPFLPLKKYFTQWPATPIYAQKETLPEFNYTDSQIFMMFYEANDYQTFAKSNVLQTHSAMYKEITLGLFTNRGDVTDEIETINQLIQQLRSIAPSLLIRIASDFKNVNFAIILLDSKPPSLKNWTDFDNFNANKVSGEYSIFGEDATYRYIRMSNAANRSEKLQVVRHEFGHGVGIPHNALSGSIMSPPEKALSYWSVFDMATISLIYNPKNSFDSQKICQSFGLSSSCLLTSIERLETNNAQQSALQNFVDDQVEL